MWARRQVVSMACSGACYEMVDTMEYAPYSTGAKYCSECKIYMFNTSNFCPCCRHSVKNACKEKETRSYGSELLACNSS